MASVWFVPPLDAVKIDMGDGMTAFVFSAAQPRTCGERTVFFPDEECIDVRCGREEDHEGHHSDGCWCWNDDEEWERDCESTHGL